MALNHSGADKYCEICIQLIDCKRCLGVGTVDVCGTDGIQPDQQASAPCGQVVEDCGIMSRKRLRVLKRVPPIIGVCEGCLAQFKSIFTAPFAAESEIKVRFAAHKCTHSNRSVPKQPQP